MSKSKAPKVVVANSGPAKARPAPAVSVSATKNGYADMVRHILTELAQQENIAIDLLAIEPGAFQAAAVTLGGSVSFEGNRADWGIEFDMDDSRITVRKFAPPKVKSKFEPVEIDNLSLVKFGAALKRASKAELEHLARIEKTILHSVEFSQSIRALLLSLSYELEEQLR